MMGCEKSRGYNLGENDNHSDDPPLSLTNSGKFPRNWKSEMGAIKNKVKVKRPQSKNLSSRVARKQSQIPFV